MNCLIKPSHLLLICGAILLTLGSAWADAFSAYVDETGAIRLPKNFRTEMAHLGSWFVPAGDASGFHHVYTEVQTIEHYRKTGSFPDGATLVKELLADKSGNYTTGNGVHSATAEVKQWFVMIKDTKNRFPDSPLWGNGWGWALYMPKDPGNNAVTDYKQSCLGCHVPAQATDWVYTEAYPALKSR